MFFEPMWKRKLEGWRLPLGAKGMRISPTWQTTSKNAGHEGEIFAHNQLNENSHAKLTYLSHLENTGEKPKTSKCNLGVDDVGGLT